MLKFYKDKKIFITGAGLGLGQSLALELIKMKAIVYISDLNLSFWETSELSPKEKFIVDVSDPLAIKTIATKIGSCDIIIANAGLGGINPAPFFNLEMHILLHQVNALGTANTFAPFINSMVQKKQGNLVAISSLASVRGMPSASSYSSSKAAQRIFCESFRADLRPYGVKVTCILPGFIKTSMTNHKAFETPFMMTSQKAALKTLKAISKGKRQYSFPLSMTLISFINYLLPSVLFDYLVPWTTRVKEMRPKIFGRE